MGRAPRTITVREQRPEETCTRGMRGVYDERREEWENITRRESMSTGGGRWGIHEKGVARETDAASRGTLGGYYY